MNLPNIAAIKGNRKVFDVASNDAAGVSKQARDARQYELAVQLFRSLDVNEVVDTFFSMMQHDLPHDSIEYHNRQFGITLRAGHAQRHRLEYSLELAGQSLGGLVMTRGRVFSSREVKNVENLLCCLVYPLRNAIRYKVALESACEDPLTGVPNRAALDNHLPRDISLAQRHGQPLSLLVVDVDHFKEVNDNYGHQTGDRALCKLVEVMRECVRGTDMIYRYGGDEFVISLPGTDREGALDVAERIRHRIERTSLELDNVRLVLSASIGIAEIHDRDTLNSVFRRADEAMLGSKKGGRNRVISA